MEAGAHFTREINEQPEALRRLLKDGRARAEEIGGRLRETNPSHVLIAARGSSDNAARYAQYVLTVRNRVLVALAVPSAYTLYEAPPNIRDAAVIGVSQSGASPDIVAPLSHGRAAGAYTVAITNEGDSPLAKAADATLELLAGDEKAVAATKTYTTELLAAAMISAAYAGDGSAWTELEALPEQVQQTLDLNADLKALGEAFKNARHFAVLGRGFNYSTAFETALKMKETCYVVAEPYSIADFLHGPVAMVDEGFPIISIAPSGKARGDIGKLQDIVKSRGARLVSVSDVSGDAELEMKLPTGIPEWLSPIAAIVPGQLLARQIAMANGYDPDAPRGLSKVTLTH